jgi:ribosomal protein L29
MSRFSAEERERILAEAHANVQHRDDEAETPLQRAMRWQPEDPIAKWKRDHPQEPEPEVKLDTALFDWSAVDQRVAAIVDARVAEAIAAEREFVLATIGEALGETLREVREDTANDLSDRVRELRRELAEAQTTIQEMRGVVAELRAVLANERAERSKSTVLDMHSLRTIN